MSATQLLSEIKIGGQTLKNRVILAPLTRGRSGVSRVPNDMMGTYYEQRASGGMLITEATAISEQGYGWRQAPGIYNQEQTDAWKKIVDRVHAKKGLIYLQLWHMGRQGHSSYHTGNDPAEVVSASAIAVGSGEVTTVDGKKEPYQTPRALETKEIPGIVDDYRKAAAFCKAAGFDGVEIHAANGYLIDQFLQSSTNKRTDKYGGSKENRVRFLEEIVEAVATVYAKNRIGVRFAPNGAFGGMGSDDNHSAFVYFSSCMEKHGLAYLHIMDGTGFGFHAKDKLFTCADARKVYSGFIMANVGLTRDTAEGMIRSGAVDLAAFGRPYIANPDLVERFANDYPLAVTTDMGGWWTPEYGAKGYTDYPVYTPPKKDGDSDKKETPK